MNIEGMGPAVVKSLISAGLVKDISDLYSLKTEEVEPLERMGKKSAEKLILSIENSKSRKSGEKPCFSLRRHRKSVFRDKRRACLDRGFR